MANVYCAGQCYDQRFQVAMDSFHIDSQMDATVVPQWQESEDANSGSQAGLL